MYRLKRDRALGALVEAEFEKDARNAIVFAAIGATLNYLHDTENKISIFGITLNLQDNFLLNGAICAAALYYGASCLLLLLKLYGVGRPSSYEHFYKRYIFRRRNKSGDRYKPKAAKREARAICVFLDSILVISAFAVIPVYVYGVALTFHDLLRVFEQVFKLPVAALPW